MRVCENPLRYVLGSKPLKQARKTLKALFLI